MALFLGVHTLPLPKSVTGSWESYKSTCTDLGISALHAYSSDEKGVAYCITEASSSDAVLEAHQKADVPVDDVFEVVRSE